MHSLARDLYSETAASTARASILGSGPFCFDVGVYSTMQNEYRMVGMVMAWSVVTLETIANHQIASLINNKLLATVAIEYPQTVVEKLKIGQNVRSELAKKLIILAGNYGKLESPDGTSLVPLAESLADARNRIVHDKPYALPNCRMAK